ncbi:hypothetical protein ACIBG8_19405 [Nonomuraea sp. NPDC050556]|uniref:hypothetical protein n=1 Tax=Nonomuraea sp. NPDC050556 TaxID=3364369 RepID=UPI0037A6B776
MHGKEYEIFYPGQMAKLWDTEHSKDFLLKEIRELDGDGLWVCTWGPGGVEVEVTIKGLTYGTLADYIRNNRPED